MRFRKVFLVGLTAVAVSLAAPAWAAAPNENADDRGVDAADAGMDNSTAADDAAEDHPAAYSDPPVADQAGEPNEASELREQNSTNADDSAGDHPAAYSDPPVGSGDASGEEHGVPDDAGANGMEQKAETPAADQPPDESEAANGTPIVGVGDAYATPRAVGLAALGIGLLVGAGLLSTSAGAALRRHRVGA